ncbi:DUF2157 domain-containing protein [Planctomycetota bacterium]
MNEARANEKTLVQLKELHIGQLAKSEPTTVGIKTVAQAQDHLGERYRVTRCVGRGHTSVVFQAQDQVLDRSVAIKFLGQSSSIPPGNWDEARLMGQFNHPYVAQVYEASTTDSQRYIVMEWVTGRPLTLAWQGLAQEQRLQLLRKVTQGVAAAHERNIIHRDLKPSNILVTARGVPKILDFGIALEMDSDQTDKAFYFRGTPAYSAPEQLDPPVQVTTATDVYALGVLFYDLLTDSLPFIQTEPDALFASIRHTYPELPQALRQTVPLALRQTVPLALQNICLKAIEKLPTLRYPHAGALAEDIERYLRGERVWARPSFLSDKIQQEVFHHQQKLQLWRDNQLLTQREYDHLDRIYTRIAAPDDLSIVESRSLSLSQVCLYLGGWTIILGSAVLFYQTWSHIPSFWRPVPALLALGVMMSIGWILWRRNERRLAVGFLATANLLLPVTVAATLSHWGIFSAIQCPWGEESIYRQLTHAGAPVALGNLQLYLSAWCWVTYSWLCTRWLRSSIFVLFLIAALLSLLTCGYLIGGLTTWPLDMIAGRYLFAAVTLFGIGLWLDQRGRRLYAWPAAVVGQTGLVFTLSLLALSERSLFGWLHLRSDWMQGVEPQALSFFCNGLVYLTLAGLCQRLRTPLQRRVATVFNWLGSLHLLTPLRLLDQDGLDLHPTRQLVYRITLPIVSLVLVFTSVVRQMRAFFLSGLAGLATAIHRLTTKHLDRFFSWPVALIVSGLLTMLLAWWIPRWRIYKSRTR